MKIKIQLVPSQGGLIPSLPHYATSGSAAFDLAACIDVPITLQPGDSTMIPTGMAFELPSPEFVMLIFARSGLSVKHGVSLSNGVGVIDSDYRGQVMVGLVNNGNTGFTIEHCDRIAQAAILPVVRASFDVVPVLSDSLRGTGGFGSTGAK